MTATAHLSNGNPWLTIIALLVSITAACIERLIKRRCPASQLTPSLWSIWRASKYKPWWQARPTCLPLTWSKCAIKRAIKVELAEWATPMTGIRPSSLFGNKWSAIASPIGRGWPLAGFKWDSKPGPALTSIIAPRWELKGLEISSTTKSMPATSKPTIRADSVAMAAMLGWILSVTSKATLPLRWIKTCLSFGGVS